MYKVEILDKYHFIYVDYKVNSATTRTQVLVDDRKVNTIVTYLDFKGFLHIDLFIGTSEEINDETWNDDSNWITTKLIYHKCFNKTWDDNFSNTANSVLCVIRFRGNILNIQNVPAYDNCGEVYYENKTYRYKCICRDDDKYGDITNWEEYDFQLIIDDIVDKVTKIFTNIEDNNLGLVTPDENEIENLIEDLFIKWLTDAKLQEVVNNWLATQDIETVIKEWLDNQDYSIFLKTVMIDWLNNQDLQPIIAEFMSTQDIQELINVYMDKLDLTDFIQNAIRGIIENTSSELVQSIIEEYLKDYDFSEYINEAVNSYLDEHEIDISSKLDVSVYNADKATFALKSELPDTDNFATKTELTEGLEEKIDIAGGAFTGAVGIPNLSIMHPSAGAMMGITSSTNDINIRTLNAGIDSMTFNVQYATPLKITEAGIFENNIALEDKYALKDEIPTDYATKEQVNSKQDNLVSGVNVKTINGSSILGSGNIVIETPDGGIIDASQDGKLYGRKDGEWSEVVMPDVSDFITSTEIEDMVTTDQLSNYETIQHATETYQPKGDYATKSEVSSVSDSLTDKQDTLVSGTNIKTVNGQTLLGSGNVQIDAPEIPTNVSAFTNDAGYLTSIPEEYITDTELNDAIGNVEVDVANDTNAGTIKIGYVENNKNYAVKLDGDNKAYVTVPWENTTYSNATTEQYGLIKLSQLSDEGVGDHRYELGGTADMPVVQIAEAWTSPITGLSTSGLMPKEDKAKLNFITYSTLDFVTDTILDQSIYNNIINNINNHNIYDQNGNVYQIKDNVSFNDTTCVELTSVQYTAQYNTTNGSHFTSYTITTIEINKENRNITKYIRRSPNFESENSGARRYNVLNATGEYIELPHATTQNIRVNRISSDDDDWITSSIDISQFVQQLDQSKPFEYGTYINLFTGAGIVFRAPVTVHPAKNSSTDSNISEWHLTGVIPPTQTSTGTLVDMVPRFVSIKIRTSDNKLVIRIYKLDGTAETSL